MAYQPTGAAGFAKGFLGGLGNASDFLYRQGQLQRQREADERAAAQLKILEEENERARELQPLTVREKSIKNEMDGRKNSLEQKALTFGDAWTSIEGTGNYVTPGTGGRTYQFDVNGILENNKTEFLRILNVDPKLNLGYGDDGKTLKANQIVDVQKIPENRGGGWAIINRREDGSSEGPMTDDTSSNPNSNVVVLDDAQFYKLANNALSDSYAIGKANANIQAETFQAFEDAVVRNKANPNTQAETFQAFVDAVVRDLAEESAKQNVDPSVDPGLYRRLVADIKTADGSELDELLVMLNPNADPAAIRSQAEDEFRRRQSQQSPPQQPQVDPAIIDELESLKSQDDSGRVTYSDPKRAQTLINQLKKQGADPEVKKLVNTAGRKQQGENAQSYTEMAADLAEYAYEWVKENPVDAALLLGSGLLLSNPLAVAGRGAVATVRGAPAAIRWLTKKALLRKKKGGNLSDTRKNQRASKEEIKANQEQRNVDNTFNNRPDYSDYDIPKPFRTQRGMDAQVKMRGTSTQAAGQTRPGRFDGYEVSPNKAGVIAGGTYLYRQTADDDQPAEIEKTTGIKPQFRFNSDDALRQAVMNEVRDPDSEATKRYMQARGINNQNFYQEVRKQPTEEQLRIIFAVAKNSGKPIDEQLKLVDSLTNQLMRGNTTTTALQQQQADNQTRTSQATLLNARRQYEKQQADLRSAGKPNQADQRKAFETTKTIKNLLTDARGNYTLEKQGEAINLIGEMAGKYATAKPADKQVWGNQLTESMLTHIQAVGERGNGRLFEWARKWENFWNNDAKLRVGTQGASSLLRADIQVVDGKEEVVGLYFRDPGTTSKPLDFPWSITELYGMYEGRAAEQLIELAIVNTLMEAQAQGG